MLMNYHIGRPVLSSLCVGVFVAAGIWWCSFCRLKQCFSLTFSMTFSTVRKDIYDFSFNRYVVYTTTNERFQKLYSVKWYTDVT